MKHLVVWQRLRMQGRGGALMAALILLIPAIFLGACGDDGAGKSSAAAGATGSGTPEAVEADAEAPAVSKPAKPKTLRLIDGGNPTVFVRLGEVLELRDAPGGRVVQEVTHATQFGSRTVFAVTEQKGKWAAVLTPYTENGEPLWVKLDPEILRAGLTRWNIEVDLSDYETTLYLDGEVERRFDVAIGMPTAPTPTGRFAVTDTFRGKLNASYGCCALATTARQVNLPSGWLGGDRIAIHGNGDGGPLQAQVSHGCVRAEDDDVSALVDVVPPGTPVEIHQ